MNFITYFFFICIFLLGETNMKTGYYWIITGDRDSEGNYIHVPALEEGTFQHYGALMVNRMKDYQHNPEKWSVSCVNTGSAICVNKTLAEARSIAKELNHLEIWNVKSHDELRDAVVNPDYKEVIAYIRRVAKV